MPSNPALWRRMPMGGEIAARIGLALFAASTILNLVNAFREPDWLMIPAFLVGWYVTDLMSGVVHMVLDYRKCPPIVGLAWLFDYDGERGSEEYLRRKAAVMPHLSLYERLVFDFKNHHPRPDALGRQGTLELISATVLLGQLPLSIALNATILVAHIPSWLLLGITTFLVGGALAQYFHGTLHRAQNPWPIRVMRHLHLLMTPQAHAVHHATLRQDFATVSGWSNPLLNICFLALRQAGWFSDEGLTPSH